MPGHPEHLLFETELLRVTEYRCAGHDGSGEHSAEHEVVLPRSGSYVRRDASGDLVADANQVLFFHRGQSFDIQHPDSGGDRSTDFALKGSTAVELAREFDPSAVDRPGRPFPLAGFTLRRAGTGLALNQLTAAARGPQHEPLYLEELALTFVGSILRQAFAVRRLHGDGKAEARVADHRRAAARVRLLLRRRLGDPLSLKQLADQAGYSPYHLCRVFKRQTGLTIHGYRQQLRLRESLDLLLEYPQRSVAEIGLALGFSSHSHFTSAFQGGFAQTPRTFRARANRSTLRELRKILKD